MSEKGTIGQAIAEQEQTVAERKEYLHSLLHEIEKFDASTVDAALVAFESGKEYLAKLYREAATLEAETAEVAIAKQDAAVAAEIARARRKTAKAIELAQKRTVKVDRYLELLGHAVKELAEAGRWAYMDAPKADKPRPNDALFANDRKLKYALTVALYRAGVIVPIASVPSSTVKVLTASEWAEQGGKQISPEGA